MEFAYRRSYRGPVKMVIFDWAGRERPPILVQKLHTQFKGIGPCPTKF